MKLRLDQLRITAAKRPPGYMEDVLARATNITDTHYELSDEAFGELRIKYRPKPLPIPDDFDPEQERRRMQQGGCCGRPSISP